MLFDENEISRISALLSLERLKKLSDLTGSLSDAIALHQETLHLGAHLMGLIATIEISIRNSLCENLREYFKKRDWLLNPPKDFQWKKPERDKIAMAHDSAQRAEYAKLSQADKAKLDTLAFPLGRPKQIPHQIASKKRRRCIIVSDGKIIAELTFYFWKRIYGPDYEHSLWKRTLKHTFPNKNIERSEVADHLENIYQARNRLAHHEPVLHGRFDESMRSIKFISQNLGVKPTETESPLLKLIKEDIDFIEISSSILHRKLDSYRVQREP